MVMLWLALLADPVPVVVVPVAVVVPVPVVDAVDELFIVIVPEQSVLTV